MLRRAANYLPAFVVAAATWWASSFGLDPLRNLGAGTEAAAYQTFAGVSGALLGFGLTAFSVLFAVAPRTRLNAVLAYGGGPLRQWLTGALVALTGSAFGFALLLPIDDESGPHGARFVAVALAAVALTATLELVWLANRFFRVLSIQALEEERRAVSAPPFEVIPPDPTKHSVPRQRRLRSRDSA